MGDLSNSGGINLLVYVVRNDKRRGENLLKNYSLIRRVFCDSKVPIVIIITGCENERPTWGSENELSQAGMAFNGHACVCAIEGRNRDYQEVVRQLVVKHCLPEGWKQVLHHRSRSSRVQNSLRDFNLETGWTAATLRGKTYRLEQSTRRLQEPLQKPQNEFLPPGSQKYYRSDKY